MLRVSRSAPRKVSCEKPVYLICFDVASPLEMAICKLSFVRRCDVNHERTNILSVWNTHSRITDAVALCHIEDLSKFTPPVSINSQHIPTPSLPSLPADGTPVDLDTPDEEAIRSLIMGIVHRTLGDLSACRRFLEDAVNKYPQIKCSTWVGGVALFELAVLDLKEVEAEERNGKSSSEPNEGKLSPTGVERWEEAIKSATTKLDKAMNISGKDVDLSSRLDSRVMMLKDEMALKRKMLTSSTEQSRTP